VCENVFDDLFGPTDLIIASTFVCVVLAVVVWSRVQSGGRRKASEGGVRGPHPTALFPLLLDWILSAMNFVIGILLGVALNGLIQLVASGAWVAVLNLVVLAISLFLIVKLHGLLGETLFPSGIRPARNPKKKPKPPAIRRFSLPTGLALGVLLAQFGLTDWLAGWLL
jgi:small-conductance mechanosensitive channel